MTRVQPHMLRLAREWRELNQTELSALAGMSQGRLSKIENGVVDADSESADRLAKALNVPTEMLSDTSFVSRPVPSGMYRKRSSLPVSRRRSIEAVLNMARLAIGRLQESIEYPPPAFPEVKLGRQPVGYLAEEIRARWGVPPGPLANLTAILEEQGVFVLSVDLSTHEVDGVSLSGDGHPPLILLNRGMPGDRHRFTLAHEFAHLVLHHHLPLEPRNCEQEADLFASSLLMPSREMRAALGVGRLTLERIAQIKARWGVAMQAVIMRAYQLGRISERQKRSLFQQISARGWRRNEPIEIPVEEPNLVFDMIDTHREDLNYSLSDIGRAAHMAVSDVERLFVRPGAQRGLHIVHANQ